MKKLNLFKMGDQIFENGKDGNILSVKILWARPVSGKGKEVLLIKENGEYEIIDGLDVLEPQSRTIIEDALEKNYIVPKITEIIRTDVFQGNRYFTVKTDRGACKFVIKNPYVSIRRMDEDGIHIVDVVGNQYLIPSVKELDLRSKKELEKVC